MSAPRAVPQLAWPSVAELTMPGSKSVANRLLVAAALCGREVAITNATPSDDVRHLANGLRTLGFAVAHDEPAQRIVVGPRRADAPARGELFCGNAGTALRFLVSVAAITPGEWTITGDDDLQRRPIGPLVDAWRQLDVEIGDTNGCPPVRVRGRADVRGGIVPIDPSTSGQFVSSLMLVGATRAEGLQAVFTDRPASFGYIDLTAQVLARFGVRVEVDCGCATVQPGHGALPASAHVDGDWSSYGVWTCLNHLTGSRIRPLNLWPRGEQPDEGLSTLLEALPRTGDCTIDVAAMPDQFCNLAVVAAHRTGTTTFTGGANLRVKECDRIAVMARELARLGVRVEERADGLVVHGGAPLRGGTIDPANDHRVAMAFALAGLLSPGIAIAQPGCVAKSYPGFWADLELVRTQRRAVVVVGMRAAGKSTFARAFAARTGVRCIDLDEQFERAQGPIAAFVAANGWAAFRAHERKLLSAASTPETVVATGGGVVDTDEVVAMLRVERQAIWLDADLPTLRARLATDAAGRPSVTGANVLDELSELLARRNPLYAAAAAVRIDASLPTERQVELALDALGAPCRWPGGPAR
jgi:3-phosphoshikimate 1-carboxyvinyltransferase